MAADLPKKFDDISKKAAGVFKDDFQCKDFSLVTKQKINLCGASSEITAPVFPSSGVKLSFKIPQLHDALKGVAVDKFDLDKDGKVAIETSIAKALHGVDGLKLEVKSNIDFKDFGNNTVGYTSTYTGLANTSVKIETKHDDPTNFTLEAAHSTGAAVLAAQLNGLTTLCPNVGANFTAGDLFAAVVAKGQFTEFNVHAAYQATSEAKVAATYQHGGKKSGDWAVGAAYQLSKDLSAKAKFESNQTASVAFKKALAKGTTLFGGVSYAMSGKITYGAKLQIE
jgi:hypothetical protein